MPKNFWMTFTKGVALVGVMALVGTGISRMARSPWAQNMSALEATLIIGALVLFWIGVCSYMYTRDMEKIDKEHAREMEKINKGD